jgi:tetratricopeptide (TPR) repeat protein
VPGAWLAAAIWALHPIQVESVAWITERKNTLCGVLFFGSILTFLRYAGFSDPDWMPRAAVPAPAPDAPDAKPEEPWQPWQWWLLSLVIFAGAMLSKTIACALPVCVLLILWWKGRLNPKYALATVPFFAIGLGLGIVTIVMEATHVGARGPDWDLSVAQRVLIAGRAVWFYIYKLLVPINLTFSYERWNVDATNVGQWLFPLGVVAVLVVLWFSRRRIGIGPLVAALWFVVTLAPALGFINTYPMRYSFVADHFQYLSGVALIVLAVGAIAQAMGPLSARAAAPSTDPQMLSGPDSRPATAVVISGILLAALGYLTWSQTHLYKDSITLWRDVVQKNPGSWMANQNLAAGLLELARVDRALENVEELNKRLDEAEASLARSIDLRQNNPDAWVNLGNVNLQRGRPADARACFAKAAELNPQQVGAWLGLGVTSAEAGKLEEAEHMYRKVLEIHSTSAAAQQGLGAVYVKQGKRDEAIAAYEKAVELNPAMSDARFQLAALLVAAGKDSEAEQEYRAILQRNPYHAESWSNLGFLVAAKGNTRANIRDARQYFQAALRINPDLPRARMGLKMADDLLSGRLPTSGPATTRAAAAASSMPATSDSDR